jgi:hypothetical protein
MLLEVRRAAARGGDWVFPSATRSGHLEKSTLKKPHAKACQVANVAFFTLYSFATPALRDGLLSWTRTRVAYLARHSDFATTRRYVHPQVDMIVAAIERARKAGVGTKTKMADGSANSASSAIQGVHEG